MIPQPVFDKFKSMKSILTIILIALVAASVSGQSEIIGRTIPSVNIKTIEGMQFNTSDISNDGKPILLTFWAIWCKSCINELNAIAEVYDQWQEETGMKIVAISIDDSRTQPKVAPMVSGNGWEYEVYSDPNGDFKRAMGVNLIPHLFIIDGNMKVVYQHTSYAEGNESELYEIIRQVAEGKPVEHE
jgi:peroxiredoxin